jgi:hypothetical protein
MGIRSFLVRTSGCSPRGSLHFLCEPLEVLVATRVLVGALKVLDEGFWEVNLITYGVGR